MKYFKFTMIDAETGISWNIKQPISGPSMPEIPGLTNVTNLSYDPIFYVGEVSDEAQSNPENYCFELTLEEYAIELKRHITNKLQKVKDSAYLEEKSFRNGIFDKYHDTATVAGVYKYEQAKKYLADPTSSVPDLELEASTRDVSVETLANRIVSNHEEFRAKEAKIAGIRGKIIDRANNFVFDLSNPAGFLQEFNTEEVIGTETVKVPSIDNPDGELVEKDVVVNKYAFEIQQRFRFA